MKLGFIGTGVMGKAMAGHLQKAGHDYKKQVTSYLYIIVPNQKQMN